MTVCDAVIIGQGLAGTTLALELTRRGCSVGVIDPGSSVTASRIAAGLITPITGKRLARAWRWDEFWSTARNFYADVARRLGLSGGASLLDPCGMVRLFATPEEAETLAAREPVRSPWPALDERHFDVASGAFERRDAGRLDVGKYLRESRASFARTQRLVCDTVEIPGDLRISRDRVELPRLGLKSRFCIFAEGAAARWNPYFPEVRFNPAKGEILSLHVPDLTETRTIHRDLWVTRDSAGHYRAGATYDWTCLDDRPTSAGREQIERQLRRLMRLRWNVTGHVAAVRPTMHDFMPVVGRHREWPSLVMFNGLGSRGALQSPGLAQALAEHLLNGGSIDPVYDVDRFCRRR